MYHDRPRNRVESKSDALERIYVLVWCRLAFNRRFSLCIELKRGSYVQIRGWTKQRCWLQNSIWFSTSARAWATINSWATAVVNRINWFVKLLESFQFLGHCYSVVISKSFEAVYHKHTSSNRCAQQQQIMSNHGEIFFSNSQRCYFVSYL
jgi:hypothetical protein